MNVKLQQVAWPPVLVFHATLFFSQNDTDGHGTEKFVRHEKQGMKVHPRNCPCPTARAHRDLGHTYHDRWTLVIHFVGFSSLSCQISTVSHRMVQKNYYTDVIFILGPIRFKYWQSIIEYTCCVNIGEVGVAVRILGLDVGNLWISATSSVATGVYQGIIIY